MTLLKDQQLSEKYGIPLPTLRTWRSRRSDGPPFLRLGRSIYYDGDDVEKWLRSRRVRCTAQKPGSVNA